MGQGENEFLWGAEKRKRQGKASARTGAYVGRGQGEKIRKRGSRQRKTALLPKALTCHETGARRRERKPRESLLERPPIGNRNSSREGRGNREVERRVGPSLPLRETSKDQKRGKPRKVKKT